MQKLNRNINIGFRVTEKEQKLIRAAQERTGITNLRAYLLKMAVNGRVINLELTTVDECAKLLRSLSNNVNQLAKRANEGRNVYKTDIDDLKRRLDEVWVLQEKIIKILTKIVEVA